MRLWAILLNYMFVNATNQLTRRSHIQFKAFTHENKTRKRNVIVYYYDEDDIPYIRLCSYRCCNFIRIWGELTWVWIHHVPLSNKSILHIFEYELCKPNKIIDLIIFMSAYSGTHTQTYISENLQSDDIKTTLNYFEEEY